MAGSVHRRDKTWSYWVDVGRDENGRRRQKTKGGFKTKRQAEEELRKYLNQLDSGFSTDTETITFGAYLDRWLDHHRTQVEPKTWQRYESIVRLYLRPRLGHMQLAKIRPAHVQALLDGIDRAPRTIQHDELLDHIASLYRLSNSGAQIYLCPWED